jgi:hypothetical protein
VAGGIIAKLPPSWKNFAISLKHKRQEFSVSDLIGSVHVEEKCEQRTHMLGELGGLVPMWYRRKTFNLTSSRKITNLMANASLMEITSPHTQPT